MKEENFFVFGEYDTINSADSIEFCPFKDKKELFVCGTYQLKEEEGKQRKYGKIDLLDSSKYTNQNILTQMKPISSLESEAILDIKWNTEKLDGKILLSQVEMGGFRLIQLLDDDNSHLLKQIQHVQTDPTDVCLSLDWDNKLIKEK